MEALKCYVTESDSDEEDPTVQSTSPSDGTRNVICDIRGRNDTESCKNVGHRRNPESVEDELLKSETQTPEAFDDGDKAEKRSDPNSNFFNLQNEESDEEGSSCKKPKIDKKVINSRGEEITIPGSDFWCGVTTEEASSLSDVSLTQKKSDCMSSAVKLGQHDQSSSLTMSRINRERTSGHGHNTRAIGTSQTGYGYHTRVVENSQTKQRQLFYIHSKVSPHLSKNKTGNRAPNEMETEITGHSGVVNRVTWNVANYSHLFLSVSMDTTIKIWNIWTQLEPCVKVLSIHRKAVKDAVWSLCGKRILSCGYDKMALLTDVETDQQVGKFESSSFVTSCKLHPVDPNLCITGAHNIIQAWDHRSPDGPCRKYVHKDSYGQVQDLVFSRDGDMFFSASDELSRDSSDRNIMAWDFRSGVVLSNQIYQERYSCTRLKVHQKGGQLLAQSHGNYIAIFSMNRPYKMNKAKRFEGHKMAGYSVGFDISPDGEQVISGGADGRLFLYNFQSGKLFRTLPTGLDVCLDVAFHPVLPSTVVCCGWNGNVQVWH